MACDCGLGGECIGKCQKIPGALRKVAWRKGRINTLPRPLGLEVELSEWGTVPCAERMTYSESRFRYTVSHDGSVQPSHREMNLWPMAGDAYLAGVLALAEYLHDHEAKVNRSCGLHVHVDARDYSYWDARRLLKVYENIERELYEGFTAVWRRTNQYARRLDDTFARDPIGRAITTPRIEIRAIWRCKSTSDIKQSMMEWVYLTGDYQEAQGLRANRIPDGYGGVHTQVRYLGLNPHSWMHRGTWEWRMKEGTLAPAELVFWPLLCGWIVHLATGISDREAESINLSRLIERMPKMVREWAKEVRSH